MSCNGGEIVQGGESSTEEGLLTDESDNEHNIIEAVTHSVSVNKCHMPIPASLTREWEMAREVINEFRWAFRPGIDDSVTEIPDGKCLTVLCGDMWPDPFSTVDVVRRDVSFSELFDCLSYLADKLYAETCYELVLLYPDPRWFFAPDHTNYVKRQKIDAYFNMLDQLRNTAFAQDQQLRLYAAGFLLSRMGTHLPTEIFIYNAHGFKTYTRWFVAMDPFVRPGSNLDLKPDTVLPHDPIQRTLYALARNFVVSKERPKRLTRFADEPKIAQPMMTEMQNMSALPLSAPLQQRAEQFFCRVTGRKSVFVMICGEQWPDPPPGGNYDWSRVNVSTGELLSFMGKLVGFVQETAHRVLLLLPAYEWLERAGEDERSRLVTALLYLRAQISGRAGRGKPVERVGRLVDLFVANFPFNHNQPHAPLFDWFNSKCAEHLGPNLVDQRLHGPAHQPLSPHPAAPHLLLPAVQVHLLGSMADLMCKMAEPHGRNLAETGTFVAGFSDQQPPTRFNTSNPAFCPVYIGSESDMDLDSDSDVIVLDEDDNRSLHIADLPDQPQKPPQQTQTVKDASKSANVKKPPAQPIVNRVQRKLITKPSGLRSANLRSVHQPHDILFPPTAPTSTKCPKQQAPSVVNPRERIQTKPTSTTTSAQPKLLRPRILPPTNEPQQQAEAQHQQQHHHVDSPLSPLKPRQTELKRTSQQPGPQLKQAQPVKRASSKPEPLKLNFTPALARPTERVDAREVIRQIPPGTKWLLLVCGDWPLPTSDAYLSVKLPDIALDVLMTSIVSTALFDRVDNIVLAPDHRWFGNPNNFGRDSVIKACTKEFYRFAINLENHYRYEPRPVPRFFAILAFPQPVGNLQTFHSGMLEAHFSTDQFISLMQVQYIPRGLGLDQCRTQHPSRPELLNDDVVAFALDRALHHCIQKRKELHWAYVTSLSAKA